MKYNVLVHRMICLTTIVNRGLEKSLFFAQFFNGRQTKATTTKKRFLVFTNNISINNGVMSNCWQFPYYMTQT